MSSIEPRASRRPLVTEQPRSPRNGVRRRGRLDSAAPVPDFRRPRNDPRRNMPRVRQWSPAGRRSAPEPAQIRERWHGSQLRPEIRGRSPAQVSVRIPLPSGQTKRRVSPSSRPGAPKGSETTSSGFTPKPSAASWETPPSSAPRSDAATRRSTARSRRSPPRLPKHSHLSSTTSWGGSPCWSFVLTERACSTTRSARGRCSIPRTRRTWPRLTQVCWLTSWTRPRTSPSRIS